MKLSPFKLNCFVLFFFILISHVAISMPKNFKLAIILWRGETAAEKGLKDKLLKLGYSVEYQIYNANQNRRELANILRNKINYKKVDYIYTFGTTVTLATKSVIKNTIPQIFNIVAFPVDAKIIDPDLNENITGVSNNIPIMIMFRDLMTVIDVKKLAILHHRTEKNSQIAAEKIIEMCKLYMHVKCIKLPVRKEELHLKNALSQLTKKRIDAVFLPADSFLASQAEIIAKYLRDFKIPSFSASIPKYVKKGILMGYIADYFSLGEQVANIIHEHRMGKNFKEIKVRFPKTYKLVINEETAKEINFEITEKIKKIINK